MFVISDKPINVEVQKKTLQQDNCGGFCSFEGWVRDHNNQGQVSRLEYSAYEALAVKTGTEILEQAKKTFDIEDAICIHRVGVLEIGDMAVWIGVSAKHRDATFEACRYIIDTIKADVPIWKKEFYFDKTLHEWVSNVESHP